MSAAWAYERMQQQGSTMLNQTERRAKIWTPRQIAQSES
jgi:hypothetical protein